MYMDHHDALSPLLYKASTHCHHLAPLGGPCILVIESPPVNGKLPGDGVLRPASDRSCKVTSTLVRTCTPDTDPICPSSSTPQVPLGEPGRILPAGRRPGCSRSSRLGSDGSAGLSTSPTRPQSGGDGAAGSGLDILCSRIERSDDGLLGPDQSLDGLDPGRFEFTSPKLEDLTSGRRVAAHPAMIPSDVSRTLQTAVPLDRQTLIRRPFQPEHRFEKRRAYLVWSRKSSADILTNLTYGMRTIKATPALQRRQEPFVHGQVGCWEQGGGRGVCERRVRLLRTVLPGRAVWRWSPLFACSA